MDTRGEDVADLSSDSSRDICDGVTLDSLLRLSLDPPCRLSKEVGVVWGSDSTRSGAPPTPNEWVGMVTLLLLERPPLLERASAEERECSPMSGSCFLTLPAAF